MALSVETKLKREMMLIDKRINKRESDNMKDRQRKKALHRSLLALQNIQAA